MANIPAPVGGLNYRDPISMMAPTDALVLDNFIPTQTGVQLRKGWRYTTSTISLPIKSIFAYSAPVPANNKLFAAANGDIYDVTTSSPSVAQSTTGSAEDYWCTTMFATPADMFLLAVSPGAGYWTYSTTSGWVHRTPAGLPSNVKTVMVWKQRIWFTAEGDSNVYYLDSANAVTGTAVAFPMGSLLRNGGYVAGLINWTVDAGFNFDDRLVVVGTEGDIGVWEGYDPTSIDTFSLKGVWYVGPVPRYGRFFTPFGGDVMLVAETGLVPLSKLVAGQWAEGQLGPAQKIQTVLNPLITLLKNTPSWDVFIEPASSVLIINVPQQTIGYQQFAMNVNTGSWCTFSGLPMSCTTILNGQLYFGTEDGRVAKGLFGNNDGVETDGTGGDTIEGDLQTAFNAFGTPAQLKKIGMARPIFIAPEAPTVKLQVNTQYTFSNVAGSPSFNGVAESKWNAAVWNTSRWIGAANTYQAWVGTTGLGYYAALRMKVRGKPGTIFTSSHMMTELGGVM